MENLIAFIGKNLVETTISFFNSNFFVALVGLTIFGLYLLQRRDFKKDAANAIFYEIKSAEKVLKKIRENLDEETLVEDELTMQVESWSKYKYLFIRDFDRDEWDAINDFYNKCQLIDESVRYNKTFFQKNEEQIRVNKFKVLADFIKQMVEDKNEDIDESERILSERIGMFDKYFSENQTKYMYSPRKPVLDVKSYTKDMNITISFTSVGSRLKKIARIRP